MIKPSKKCILLTEDDQLLAFTESEIIQSFGYEVVIANDGETAVKIATGNNNIDLVLMDVNLGSGIDGTEAARRILAIRDLPIVFLTAHSEREMVEKVKGITRYGYVIKRSGSFVLESSIEMAFELFESHMQTRKSEEKFKSVIESSPVGFHFYELLLDDRLVFTSANPSANRILGVDNSIFIGKTIEEAFPPLIATDIPLRYREVAKTGMNWNIQQIDYLDDAIRGCFDVFVFRISDRKIGVQFFEVTERKQAEEKLRDSERRYQAILEGAAEGILIARLETKRFVYANPMMCSMLGYDISEIKTMSVFDIHPPDDLPHVLEQFERQSSGEIKLAPSIPCLRKDGSLFWVDIVTSEIAIDGMRCNVGFFTDITPRKHAEDLLKQSNANYRIISEVQNSLFNAIPDIIGVQDVEHRIVRYNQAGYDFLGLDPKEVIGRKCYELIGRSSPCDLCATADVYQTKKLARIEKYFEKTGQWLDVRCYPVLDEKGDLLYVVEHIRDITETIASEEKIKSLLQEKERLLDELRRRIN